MASIESAILQTDPACASLVSGSVSLQYVMDTCSNAQATLGDYALWQTIEAHLVSALGQLDEFDRLFREGPTDNELELLCKLNTAKYNIGAVQSCLMCPSEVDPIVTARTKYLCIQYQVRCELNICASNIR